MRSLLDGLHTHAQSTEGPSVDSVGATAASVAPARVACGPVPSYAAFVSTIFPPRTPAKLARRALSGLPSTTPLSTLCPNPTASPRLMSSGSRRQSSRVAALEPPPHAHVEPTPNRPLSLYRAPRRSKKKGRTKRARHAALVRWGNQEASTALAAPATAVDHTTVQWGKLCTHAAMASAVPGLDHLLAVGALKSAPHSGSRRLRAVAAAVLAAELGRSEHVQLGPTEFSMLAHGFARRPASKARPTRGATHSQHCPAIRCARHASGPSRCHRRGLGRHGQPRGGLRARPSPWAHARGWGWASLPPMGSGLGLRRPRG